MFDMRAIEFYSQCKENFSVYTSQLANIPHLFRDCFSHIYRKIYSPISVPAKRHGQLLNLAAIVLTCTVFLLLDFSSHVKERKTSWNDLDEQRTVPSEKGNNNTVNNNVYLASNGSMPKEKLLIKNREHANTSYVTMSFTSCGGGFSAKLFEFISLYGIARTLKRKPYINLNNICIMNHFRKAVFHFPNLTPIFEVTFVQKELTTDAGFAYLCCTYQDVGQLKRYESSHYLTLIDDMFQSYKYFNSYRSEVVKLLSFSQEDIAAADKIVQNLGEENDKHDVNNMICVHTRRGDFVNSVTHQHSTEEFTRAAVHYVRQKLQNIGEDTVVAILGDDRNWTETLFPNDTWVYIPEKTDRPTTDYAFFARHCRTIILTASSSTFGFWSAYLSDANTVYYNKQFAKDGMNNKLKIELTPEDFFPAPWIALQYDPLGDLITES